MTVKTTKNPVLESHTETALKLNDYFYFASLVKYGGYGAASRAIGISKSNISRHIASLEEHFGVRLVERSSRRFSITEAGMEFYENCRIVIEKAEEAEHLIKNWQGSPKGIINVSAHSGIADAYLKNLIPNFSIEHPHITVNLLISDQPVDLITDRIDVAFRVRSRMNSDVELVARTLGENKVSLVGSTLLFNKFGRPNNIESLGKMPTLSMPQGQRSYYWELEEQGSPLTFRHKPTFICSNLNILAEAAKRGVGIALLPEIIYAPMVNRGELEVVMPDHMGKPGIIHLMYTSRKVSPPVVRTFIDYITKHWPDE